MRGSDVTIRVGLQEERRGQAAALYLEAFSGKLGPILGEDDRAVSYLSDVLRPNNAVVAITAEGDVVGVAGFHDPTGGFVGGRFADLRRWYGFSGAVWRGALLHLFVRAPVGRQLLMDGVVVAPELRGQGVGVRMIEAINAVARAHSLEELRLDVVDTNPRAKALYEREGFRAVGTTSIWPFHRLFGFTRATTMARPVDLQDGVMSVDKARAS